MTDTYGDKNGVSTVLHAVHQEICRRNLPIDMMTCNNSLQSSSHLIVLEPVSEFAFPFYRQQPLRIPNFFAVRRMVHQGRYRRIICSTEGPMGWAARWMKSKYQMDVSFYLHTDWITFAREVLGFGEAATSRLQRLLRIYYRGFSSIFVLNTEQQEWLTSREMGCKPPEVHLTAHWVDPAFLSPPNPDIRHRGYESPAPVILYAGRISKEKGVFELPVIFDQVRQFLPEVCMAIAGTGPDSESLMQVMPGAIFHGWVNQETLREIYATADILVLPSRFDTFSCVVLEALSSGLPVVAYNTKGPRDILSDGQSGFLADSPEEIAGRIIEYLLDPAIQTRMRWAARARAGDFNSEEIMDRMLADLGIMVNADTV